MKIKSFIVSYPLIASILLAIVVLIVPSLLIPYWYHTIKSIQHHVELNSSIFCSKLQSEIEKTIDLLQPMNSSATNSSRLLNSPVNGNSVSFRLMNENGDELEQTENVSCSPRGTASEGSNLNIHGRNYTIYCSSLDILGVQSVYALAFPKNRLDNLLLVMVFTVSMCVLSFVLVIVKAAKREMYLCANLIRQMEATQQAERKSVNKSNAFAKASHDIRASLAAMILELPHFYRHQAIC